MRHGSCRVEPTVTPHLCCATPQAFVVPLFGHKVAEEVGAQVQQQQVRQACSVQRWCECVSSVHSSRSSGKQHGGLKPQLVAGMARNPHHPKHPGPRGAASDLTEKWCFPPTSGGHNRTARLCMSQLLLLLPAGTQRQPPINPHSYPLTCHAHTYAQSEQAPTRHQRELVCTVSCKCQQPEGHQAQHEDAGSLQGCLPQQHIGPHQLARLACGHCCR